MKTNIVAILYEDKKPIRLWKGDGCIFKAYKWAHYHFCLGDFEPMPMYKLPEWLEVKLHIMSEEQIKEITA